MSSFSSIRTAGLVLALTLTSGCHLMGDARTQPSPTDELLQWMQGQFSSEAQAAEDPDNYFDIRLFMTPIWTERPDGPWLYVEQASAAALERPYRQRVYHLVAEPEGRVRSEVYLLPGDPLAFAGAWMTPAAFAQVAPESLELRGGCDILLERVGEEWRGSTQGAGCESSLRGASYATSEVTLGPGVLRSWDRGFDDAGEQVWGATKGPYEFVRAEAAQSDD
jgi:CpeT protein